MKPLPKQIRNILIGVLFFLTAACQKQPVEADFYSSELFRDVQLAAVFPDSKTFPDCLPKRPLTEILDDYGRIKSAADFDLAQFVEVNFEPPVRPNSGFLTDTSDPMAEHINNLWPVLTREPDDKDPGSSLIGLKKPYIVPGGRFSEIYYWDSYFTMLGLKSQGNLTMIRNMIDNFAFLIDTLGFIPNGNREYYLTRSQPPFFSLMITLLEDDEPDVSKRYLGVLKKEYTFWMEGVDSIKNPGDTWSHVVVMSDGSVMNRYFDQGESPRPEAFKEDYRLSTQSSRRPEILYRDIRSAAESGWDFSSRWLTEGEGLESIRTTSIVPVDLNCLLYHLEAMLSKGSKLAGNDEDAEMYQLKANNRITSILKYCWSDSTSFFHDYLFLENAHTPVKSLAGMYPLFFAIAPPEQAKHATDVLRKEFLQPGGLLTTLNDTGEQWDAPNGWAPLQWISYRASKNYGADELAAEIRDRWLRQNRRVYRATGKMMEKYNVMDTTLQAGGGEYPNQDGFGWTNGVALALIAAE